MRRGGESFDVVSAGGDVVSAEGLVDAGEPSFGEHRQHHLESGNDQEGESQCDYDLGDKEGGERVVDAYGSALVVADYLAPHLPSDDVCEEGHTQKGKEVGYSPDAGAHPGQKDIDTDLGTGAEGPSESPSDGHGEHVPAHGTAAGGDGPTEIPSYCLVGDEEGEEQEFNTAKVAKEEV